MRSYFDHEKLKVYHSWSFTAALLWIGPSKIVSMLMGLMNSLNARIQEDAPSYLSPEQEHE